MKVKKQHMLALGYVSYCTFFKLRYNKHAITVYFVVSCFYNLKCVKHDFILYIYII